MEKKMATNRPENSGKTGKEQGEFQTNGGRVSEMGRGGGGMYRKQTRKLLNIEEKKAKTIFCCLK